MLSEKQEPQLAWVLPCLSAGLTLGILCGRSASTPLYGLCGLVLGILAAIFLKGNGHKAAMLAVFCALGVVAGQIGYHPSLPAEGDYIIDGVVCDSVVTDASTWRTRTRLSNVTLNGEPVSGVVYWSCYPKSDAAALITPGAHLTFTASVYHPSGAENPGGFDFREYLLGQGIRIGVYGCTDLAVSDTKVFSLKGTAAAIRETLSQQLYKVMGKENGAYAVAMVLGSRSDLPEDDRSAFSRVGVAHLLSVSGFHVGILAGILALLLGWCSPRFRFAVCALVLGAYCLLTGMNAPVIRASLLVLLVMYGRICHRRAIGLWMWFACYCLTLLFRPAQLTSASFQLTYAAVLGIVLVTPSLQRLWKPQHKWSKKLWSTLCASLGAQVGVFLPLCYWFQKIPLLGLVVNLVALPYASLLIGLYWIVLLLSPIPFVGTCLGTVANFGTTLLTTSVRYLDTLPFTNLWVKQANLLTLLGWLLIMVGCVRFLPIKRRRLLLLPGTMLMIVSLIVWPHHGTEYIQFSVGNADAALLHDESIVTVIDTGEATGEITDYLRQQRLSVDHLVLTHLHRDHALGLQDFIDDDIPVKEIILPWGAEDAAVDASVLALLHQMESLGTTVRHVGRGDTLSLPSGSMTVLWPETGRVRPGQDANESSLTMLCNVQGTTMLLTGDLDGIYENYAAAEADILKVPHHGSAASSSETFLAAVSPNVAIISSGDAKRHHNTAAKLPNATVYGTESCGAVIIRFTQGSYTVETWIDDE